MATTDKLFAGSIPEIYERFLVPLIFESYAADLAKRVAETKPQDVLETAAGTGVLSRALASRLPHDTRITATDLNAAHARSCRGATSQIIVESRGNRPMLWRCHLPLKHLISWRVNSGRCSFPIRSKATRKHDGFLDRQAISYSAYGTKFQKMSLPMSLRKRSQQIFPDDPPRFMARVPHGYHNVERIREELTAAGFSSIAADAVDGTSRASAPRDAAIAYCQGTPLRNEIEARDASRLEHATATATQALARRFGNGPIEGRIRAFVISAAR